jgi:phosphatidylethanolamine/phosphatidyl-N-methylethanolamine N-methyltransferase
MRETDWDRDFWEQKAPQYDRVVNGWFGRPLPRVLELTASGVSGAETVLEVAAGTGLMTAVIAPRVRQVVATDYADNMLAVLGELCQVLRPGGTLITPTFVHDETALAWVASRVLANVLGQPMHRRFTAASLRQTLEQRDLRISRAETIPGLIPIAYAESVLGGGAHVVAEVPGGDARA